MRATELLSQQLGLVHGRIAGLAGMTREEWLARPAEGENRAGFLAWHAVATRDWTIRSMLQQVRPLGWDGAFGASGIGWCAIPFGMPMEEADAIAERTSPVEVVAYSEAVTAEIVRWLGSVDDSVLAVPPSNARAHLGLSPRYDERGYRHELEEDPDDMCQWPAWALLTRPCFSHCVGHLTEIGIARAARR